MKKKRHISHGEVNLFEVDRIPKTAKKIKPSQQQLVGNGFIIANSETTGNHHLVKLAPGIEVYEDTDGTIYIRNTNITELSCVDTKRHDAVELPASTWKRKPAKEWDYTKEEKRNVAD